MLKEMDGSCRPNRYRDVAGPSLITALKSISSSVFLYCGRFVKTILQALTQSHTNIGDQHLF